MAFSAGFGPNDLTPYTSVLTTAEAKHLVRRMGFGARHDLVQALSGKTGVEAATHVLDQAAATPAPPVPDFYANGEKGGSNMAELREAWHGRMLTQPYIEKLTLFWHNHFATEISVYRHRYFGYAYYLLLRSQSLGNFKQMVREIGLNGAMLDYLDGRDNKVGNPNENYARELLELFTMGITAPDGSTNYAEADIAELARALTGWDVKPWKDPVEPPFFDPSRHDATNKTFLGAPSAPYRYYAAPTVDEAATDVINVLFSQRGSSIAHFICRKLYAYFVFGVPNDTFVGHLAQVFVTNNFELRPVLNALFSSTHFYSSLFHGAQVKSPVETVAGLVSELNYSLADANTTRLFKRAKEFGLEVFQPPDVAGWDGFNPPSSSGQPGYKTWYDVTQRSEIASGKLKEFIYQYNDNVFDPLSLASVVSSDPMDPFRLALDLAEHLIPIPLATAFIFERDEDFAGSQDIPPPAWVNSEPRYVTDLTKALLGPTPHYEWSGFTLPSGTTIPAISDDDKRKRLRDYIHELVHAIPAWFHC
ncbi:MAG: hypothetical protein RhofKO_23580 [Rhodothermales bacterium]